MQQPKTSANNPALAGKRASRAVLLGDLSQFAVFAVHTRFGAVQWFAQDANRPNEIGQPTVIAQCATFEEAVKKIA